MDICVLIFGDPIMWLLPPEDADVMYEISACPGGSLVSPLLFGEIHKLMDAKLAHEEDDLDGGFVGDLYLVKTDGIAFTLSADAVHQHKPKDIGRFAWHLANQPTPLIETATLLLDSLRHYSKQADMSRGGDDLNFWEWLEVAELPKFSPRKSRFSLRSVQRSAVATAVRKEHIEAACRSQVRPPIYDVLILDAISAHRTSDYRKSILYSAMAVESATAMMLDEHYEGVIKPRDYKEWRVLEFTVHGGTKTRKDPIWEMLKQREDANSLLHEGALYVLGRSLLAENERLYQIVQKLRSTRNKIVHHGEPPNTNVHQYLSIDASGSSDALNCAIGVLTWLGFGQDYKVHEHGFVSISSEKE
jgi:hypothetical protein